MAAPCYIAWNGVTTALTAAFAGQAVTAVKSLIQVAPGTPKLRVIEWGYSFTTIPTAVVNAELIVANVTTTTATSVTPSKYNDVTGSASSAAVLANPTGEGTVTTSRLLAYQNEWGAQFKQQFPLGREPEVNSGEFLRLRFTSANSIVISTYVIWEE